MPGTGGYNDGAMNGITRWTAWAALIWGAAVSLQAADSPQQIFTRLAERAVPGVMSPPQRMAALPALALIPPGADVVAAASRAGEDTAALLRMAGAPLCAETAQRAGCIQSAAFACMEGAEALEGVLPLLGHASRAVQLQGCEQLWLAHANPAYADAIHRAFAKRMRLLSEGTLAAYNAFHPGPVYMAATAAPGREAEFAGLIREWQQGLLAAARSSGGDFTPVQEKGYVGLRFSQLTAYRLLMKAEPRDAALRDAMAQRSFYLMVREQEGAALAVLCEHPSDILLPVSPECSMLLSAKLNGADAHMEQLRFVFRASAGFYRAVRRVLSVRHDALALAVADALSDIDAVNRDPSSHSAYVNAIQALTESVWPAPLFDPASAPLMVQAWRQEGALVMESVSGSEGMEFEEGRLLMTDQAADPHLAFYMESAAFSAPHPPRSAADAVHRAAAVLQVARALSFTLRSAEQSFLSVPMRMVDMFMAEEGEFGSALQLLGSGAESPFALLAGECESEGPAWAFCTAVSNRGALEGGWRRLLSAAERVLGVPAQSLSAYLPHVALSDTRLVIGNSAAYNERLLTAAGRPMLFRGAVSAVHIPRLAAALSQSPLSRVCPFLRSCSACLSRLAEHATALYSVSVIRDGVRTARAIILLREP